MVAPPGEWCCFILVVGLLSSVPPLTRWRYCVPIQVCPLLICWLSEGVSGKRYIPQQKSPKKGTSVRCPLGDGKSVGVAERFPWPVGWAQIGYPEKRVFRQIRSLNGNFSGIWNHVSRATNWTRVLGKFGGNRIDPSKVAEVVRRSRHKKQRLCNPFFRALSETHSAISLETCKT